MNDKNCVHRGMHAFIFFPYRVIWFNIPGVVVFLVMTCFSGMVIYAYYAMIKCDPLMAGYIDNPNQVSIFALLNISCVTELTFT